MPPSPHLIAAALLAALTLSLAGCGDAGQADELLILCGTSFGPPVEKLKTQYETATGQTVTLSFGGSEDLLPNVKGKSIGDLFVSHDPYMDYTKEAGSMLQWKQVGYVAPVMVVQKGNPKKIGRIEDLGKPGLKVILPNPDFSTCGEMLFKLLEKKGIQEAVLKNVGNRQFRSHADIGNKMKLGHGDVAVMWNGVAHNFLDALEIVPTPYEYDEEVRVGIIGLSYSEKQDKVKRFLQFAEKHGEAVFKEFGYVKTFEPDEKD